MSKRSPEELEEQRKLGRVLRYHRESLKLTRNKVADHLGTSELMVQRLEAGTAILTIPRLIKLAAAFRIDPGDLLREFAAFEAREPSPPLQALTEDEQRLLAAFHRIDDRVQRRNVLDLLERMSA